MESVVVGTVPNAGSGRKRTLADVLTEIPAAADVLVGHLAEGQCIKHARLSCQPLRKYVDDHVGEVKVIVSEAEQQRWAEGQLPTLSRWPLCSSLHLNLRPTSAATTASARAETLASLAALPFLGNEPSVRQRIKEVHVRSELPALGNAEQTRYNAEAAVRSLASLLPNLRRLDLGGLHGMSFAPFEQQFMYDSLTALPHLEDLILPGTECLNRIGTLAGGRLRRLGFECLTRGGARYNTVSRQAADGISRLQGLEELRIPRFRLDGAAGGPAAATGVAAGGGFSLAGLIDSVPASLQQLGLPACVTERNLPVGDISIQFRDQRLICVGTNVDNGFTDIVRISKLAQQLIASCAMARTPQLEKLSLEAITVPERQPLGQGDLLPLRQLVQRSKLVSVAELDLIALDSAIPAVELVGKPQGLYLSASGHWVRIALRQAGESSAFCGVAPAQPSPMSQQRGQQPKPAAVPSMEEVARRIVRTLIGPSSAAGMGLPPGEGDGVGTGAVGADTAGSSSDDAAGAAASSGSAVAQEGSGPSSSGPAGGGAAGSASGEPQAPGPVHDARGLLLVHGDFIGLLSQAPELLLGWLKWLRTRVAGSADGSEGGSCIKTYRLLPTPTAAVMLECGEAAAAVAAAVRSAAEGRSAGALEVAPVCSKADLCQPNDIVKTVYAEALEKVLQDIWDGRYVSGGTAAALGEKELLRQLVERVGELGGELTGGVLPAGA